MNVVIDVLGPDEAVGMSYMVNYRYDHPSGVPSDLAPTGDPVYIGEYRDRFVRTDGGWRFQQRRTELAFAQPSPASS